MKKVKLHKEYCEIDSCNVRDPKLLQHHHIIERVVVGTSNSPWNLGVICSNCHLLVHSGEIKIIGVYPSTNKHGRTLIYERNGIKNVEGISEAYFKHKPAGMKLIKGR